jgi:hypothetical protein
MVFELAIISVAAGAVLGLRSSVLVLVPAVLFTMLFAAIVGIARADSVWSIVLMTMELGFAVQLGYLAGMAIYAAVESISAVLARRRNHGLGGSWGSVWPHTLQAHSWSLTGPVTPLRQSQPPRV